MSTQVDPQLQASETGTVTHEAGSDDEAVALFNQRARSQADTAEETPTDDTEANPAEETTDGDPEPEEEADDTTVEVEYEGKAYKLPPELKDAVLRKADYSRNMQEVSAQKKDYAQRIELADKLTEGAQEYAKALAVVNSLDAQMEQFKNVDFDALETEDPARASLLGLRLVRLQQARDKASNDAQGVSAKLAKDKAQTIAAEQAEMGKVLDKDLPGWRAKLGDSIATYALSHGWTEQKLRMISDPNEVIVLDKARKFDAIQEAKAKALKQVKETTAQVLKPGTPRKVTPMQDAEARFKRDRSEEAAIALFQQRANRK